jgi:hypothetical protein
MNRGELSPAIPGPPSGNRSLLAVDYAIAECARQPLDGVGEDMAWISNWLVGGPLIVLTVLMHVGALGFFTLRLEYRLTNRKGHHSFVSTFILVMGIAVVGATVLHAFEGVIWATAYRLLDAVPTHNEAMLYSISAMTSFGHAQIFLAGSWQMLGALEALNGMILFGFSTAFLFAMIQRVWPAMAKGPPVGPA